MTRVLDDSIAAAEKRRAFRVAVDDVVVDVVLVEPVVAVRLQEPAAAPAEKVDRVLPTAAAEGRRVRVAVTLLPEM